MIPSRLQSKRLKQKPLLLLDGLPLIVHTYKRSVLSNKVDEVFVCTDSNKIIDVLKNIIATLLKQKKIFPMELKE